MASSVHVATRQVPACCETRTATINDSDKQHFPSAIIKAFPDLYSVQNASNWVKFDKFAPLWRKQCREDPSKSSDPSLVP